MPRKSSRTDPQILEMPAQKMAVVYGRGLRTRSLLNSCPPKIQILTINELIYGKQVEYPRHAPVATFKKAQRLRKTNGEEQNRLL